MSAESTHDIEKAPGLIITHSASPPGSTTPAQHHGFRPRERLRQFLHPSGRRIHVAADPVEADQLRSKLKTTAGDDDNFDVYVSGTSEHLEALRHAHTHQENQRLQLKERHGEVYEQFSKVQGELDSLNLELNRMTEHGVSMDAHFDRFGYSAHIKSYDEDGDAPSRSGSTTPRRVSSASGVKSAGHGGNSLKLFKTPVLRQYFHKGIIWRASKTEEVMSFELFVDLLYVGIIAINGDAAAEHPTGLSLLRFIITFSLSWKIWSDMALLISWFETDDVFQRVSILFLLACLFGYTTNIMEAFEHTYPTLIGFYLAARLYTVAYLALVAILVPMVRGVMITHIFFALISVALWIGSIHVEWPNQLALIWIALLMDLAGHTLNLSVMRIAGFIGGSVKAWSDRTYEFFPALNIEHRTERTNAFVSLVFGYTVVAILYQSAVNRIDAFFGKGILGLVQAFCYNWIYFEIDGHNLQTHAIRRHMFSALLWGLAHLPFIMSFVLGSGGLARLVLASDTKSAHTENLTELYQERSPHEVEAGHRWFYCGGFGIALVNMALISLTHVHRDVGRERIGKTYRLVVRLGVALILICLPIAERLNSLQLVATVTGLIVFLLVVELWGSSTAGSSLWSRDKPCHYTGNCGRKDLQEYIIAGKELDLGELQKSSKLKNSGVGTAPM